MLDFQNLQEISPKKSHGVIRFFVRFLSKIKPSLGRHEKQVRVPLFRFVLIWDRKTTLQKV